MPKPLFETKTTTFAELLGNSKKYNVPRFQRSYSWTESNWEDLWLDILSLKNNEETVHYLGTIVLQHIENKTVTIIDGQQRIVTLSILILACIKLLDELIEKGNEPEKNKERKEIFLNQYIGFKDPKALTYQSKLTLNDIDKTLYNSYLCQLSKPLNISKLPESNKLLINAFDYFLDKLKELNLQKGEDIVDFIESVISTRLFFIQIVVDDTISAYTVFETLNARGVELTTTDLLKNYFFSLLDNEIDINNIQPRWEKTVNTVSYSKFPDFLRYYLNSQQPIVRSEKIFKEIKNKISNKNEVINLIDELEKYSDIYVALDDPENELWKDREKIKSLLSELNLFNVQQYKSILLAAYFKMNDYLEDILRIIRAITFRYTVIGELNPNKLERVYNSTAIKIHNQEVTTPQLVQKELLSVYIDDETFKNSFSTKVFDTRKTKTKKVVRYILLSIENHHFTKEYSSFDTNVTIEHIYPENYIADEEKLEQNMIYRLGNLTLLEAKLNRECANKYLNDKKEVYKKSQYNLTKEIAENDYESWGPQEIRERQQKLAKIATAIWKLPFGNSSK